MITKLRRKFIIVIMLVVTVIVIAAFVGVFISTISGLERNSRFVLKEALTTAGILNNFTGPEHPASAGQVPGVPEHNANMASRRMPSIIVLTDENGIVVFMKNQIFNIQDSDVQAITDEALQSGKETGVLREYSLRFLIEKSPDGAIHLAFVDNAMEKTVIENLLISSALIGVSTLAIFFIISIYLARWAVRPVEKAWNSQRQFVADASHELKTPLTVILSNVSMVSGDTNIMDLTDEKTKARLENIQVEAKRMKVLVDDLLSLARSDDVKSGTVSERVNVSAVLNYSVLVFEPILFDAGKRIEYDIKEGLYINGDTAKLRQLIDIIIDNACQYSLPESLISVSLKAVKNDICFEVANESEPIPKEELPRLFERFYRLDKSRSSAGYGLGLSIAKSITDEFGGKIWAASDAGHTTISALLPAAR